MSSLRGQRVLLGVAGGVAAYKSVYLARRLLETGAEVRVVMTPAALSFVGQQTFAAVTGCAVVTSLFGPDLVSPHTEAAVWADLVVVAPTTATTLGKLVSGIADDALVATLLATKAPVVLVPAMHTEMWEHPATQRNVERLAADGYRFLGPVAGELAGGDEGMGRLMEPDDIVAALERSLIGAIGQDRQDENGSVEQDLAGYRVLVTAGGTREAIDPVRFIGNRSSGKMGHAIAAAAAGRGALVTLVTTTLLPVSPTIAVVNVESAEEMAVAVDNSQADVVVMAAAVADFRPAQPAAGKLMRSDGPPQINLVRTPDILASVVARNDRPYVVGFAAETGSLERAGRKATEKGVDLLVANDVAAAGSGFGTETNQVSIFYPDGNSQEWPLMSKGDVAQRLWDLIRDELGRRQPVRSV